MLLSKKALRPVREERGERGRSRDEKRAPKRNKSAGSGKALPLKGHPEVKMQRFRIEVGYQHDVKPGNIVGAIANEADLDSEYIGHIEIFEDHSTVDLPADMPKETFFALKKTRVCQHRMDISVAGEAKSEGKRKPLSFNKSRKKSKAKAKKRTGAGAKPRKKVAKKRGASKR